MGYGDIAPTTVAGRTLAVALMVIGVGTFAGVTAGIASYFVEAEEVREECRLERLERQIQEIQTDVRRLVNRLDPAEIPLSRQDP